MRCGLSTIVSASACLLLAGNAAAAAKFGVADNHPVTMKDGGARFFDLMNDVGLKEDRLTILWDERRPAQIPNRAALERTVAEANKHGIELVFAVYPLHATALAGQPAAQAQFVTFLQLVANAFPGVTTYVVGNEFNQPRFYQPQFGSDCKAVSGAEYMRLLARGYDALKAVDPDITVISSVSPRGNDDCRARNNRSRSPVRFIHDMGVAYGAMHRDRPAFDDFGIHIYPNQPTDSIERGYQWPKIGASNLDRLKQSLWDAFAGTAQPVPDWQPPVPRYGQGEPALNPMRIWEGEIGWQVRVSTGAGSPYYGRENVRVTTEARQARIYAQLVRMMSCDPLVDAMLIFGFVDEPDLAGFQAGLLRADWSTRPSYAAVKREIARARGGCAGESVQWRHTESVVGARVVWRLRAAQPIKQTWWGFGVAANEDASAYAGIFRVRGRELSDASRAAIVNALAGKGGATPVLESRSTINAYWSPIVRFPEQTLPRGSYVYGIRISAWMNPSRTRTFVSRAFRVGR